MCPDLNVCVQLFTFNNFYRQKNGEEIELMQKLFGADVRVFVLFIILSQTSPDLYVTENTAGKGEIALNEQFLFFPKCSLSVCRT